MKYYSLMLKAESPLAIRSDHAPGGADTARYITGTTLVGSLAATHRLLYSQDTGAFESLFLNGKVLYPNLYPAMFKEASMNMLDLPVYPLPKTAQSCKRFSGFQYMTREEVKIGADRRHGVRDSLFDWALFNTSSDPKLKRNVKDSIEILRRHKLCGYNPSEEQGPRASCSETMEPFNGYYCHDNREFFSAEVESHLRLQTRTGIDRESGTVQEGILYNRQVFDDGSLFWGMVRIDDTDDNTLTKRFQDFLEEVGSSRLVRVGTGRTRGMGNVTLAVKQMAENPNKVNALKDKLLTFSAVLSNEARDVGLQDNLKPFYFALTLHSPAILNDELLRYRGSIDEETLAQLTGLPAEKFELVYQCASTGRITGWNELWGTPRTNEYAIETGSVFLFASTQPLEDALLKALLKLEEQGIGRRRAEGFGRVCVSDPFHLEVKLV